MVDYDITIQNSYCLRVDGDGDFIYFKLFFIFYLLNLSEFIHEGGTLTGCPDLLNQNDYSSNRIQFNNHANDQIRHS